MGNLHRKETSHSLYYWKSWLTRSSFVNKNNNTQTKEKIWRFLLTPHTKTSAPNQYNHWITAALSNIYTKVLALNTPCLTNTQYTSHFLHKHLSHLYLSVRLHHQWQWISASVLLMASLSHLNLTALVNDDVFPSPESWCLYHWSWWLALTGLSLTLLLVTTSFSHLDLSIFVTDGDVLLSPLIVFATDNIIFLSPESCVFVTDDDVSPGSVSVRLCYQWQHISLTWISVSLLLGTTPFSHLDLSVFVTDDDVFLLQCCLQLLLEAQPLLRLSTQAHLDFTQPRLSVLEFFLQVLFVSFQLGQLEKQWQWQRWLGKTTQSKRMEEGRQDWRKRTRTTHINVS